MKNIRKNLPPGAPAQDYVTGYTWSLCKRDLASLFEA